ncbi:MAG TPA: tetratricopeptide repeat protein [Anaerolineales bacterium]|nr:tetratricopeptide repeat protein [Anaerolineales bacterium]
MNNPKCSKCGFNNPIGMRFCGNCGSPLAKISATVPSPLTGTLPLRTLSGKDVKERLRQAGIDAAGQRRNVTVLFADISNYTKVTQSIEDEGVFELIKRYIRVLAEEVYHYEGVVDKFTGDGLMALFGAPIAYENNAERAVRAALDMQAGIAMMRTSIQDEYGIDLQMRIGLNSGSVIVGNVGVEQMMDYTAIGDTVNLASRLETAADPSTILVSDAVYRQTKAIFHFKEVPDLQLKGYSEPITSYKVVSVKRLPGSVRGIEGLQTPMIGRKRELTKLQDAVDALQERGQGQLVLIVGEAGIGKSRLTTELKANIDQSFVGVFEGRSLTYRKSISYWIFRDLLRNYLGVSEETPENLVEEKLRHQAQTLLGTSAPKIIPFLQQLISPGLLGKGNLPQIELLDAEHLRQQIFLAVKELFVAEARIKPFIIVLEDLHWADDASIELIYFLIDALRNVPLIIYGITRPFQDGPLKKVEERARERIPDRLTIIQLHNLSQRESNQLLDQLLTIPDFPETVLNQIIQKSAGVPFYLEEILRMLIERNVIRREGEHWRLVPGVEVTTLGVPDTLNDLILTRFDRLDTVCRRVLQATSIIGREFSLTVLQMALRDQLQADQLQGALDELVHREFIISQQSEANQMGLADPSGTPPGQGQDIYTFRHVLVSDAVYGTMLKHDRGTMHLLVAQAIETLYKNRLDGYVEILANHYLRSPQLDRALYFLILAGQKAANSYASEQARQHFVTALGLLPKVVYQPSQAYQIHHGLGDVLMLVGEYQAARTHFQSAMDAIESEDSKLFVNERSDLDRKMGITFERQGDFDKALTRLSVAMHRLRESTQASPLAQGRIVNDMGWIYYRRGEIDYAEMYLNLALRQVEGTPHTHLMASIYNRLGAVYFMKEQLDQASEYVRKSLELREELGDIVEMVRTYNNLGLLEWKRGHWESALQNFRRGMELNTTLGDVEAMIQLQGNISLLQIDRGELADAEKYLLESLRRADAIGHNYLKGVAYLNLSRYWLAKKDWESALSSAHNSLEVFTAIGAQDELANTWWCMGEAQFGSGNLEKAQEAGQLVLDLLTGRGTKVLGPSQERGMILRLMGKIARVRGNLDTARQYLDESVNQFKAINNQLELGRTYVEIARWAKAAGNLLETKSFLEIGEEIFERLGAGLDLAEIQS